MTRRITGSARCRGGIVWIAAGALLFASGAASAQECWTDDLDSYAVTEDIIGQGGWEGWDGAAGATAAVTDSLARSAPNSLRLLAGSDLIQQFSGVDSGTWLFTCWVHVPEGHSGDSYVILLNTYNVGGPNNWSSQIRIQDGVVASIGGSDAAGTGTAPVSCKAWAELRILIDLDANLQTIWYDGAQLDELAWFGGEGVAAVGALDLFSNGASPIYIDDMSLVKAGVVEDFDSYATGDIVANVGAPWSGWDDTPGATADVVDTLASSGTQSVQLLPGSDLIREFCGVTAGRWVFSTQVYVPSDHVGDSYAILLNTYNAGGPYNWSTQVRFQDGVVASEGTSGGTSNASTAVIADEWVELSVEIDLDLNTQIIRYGGEFLDGKAWTSDGALAVAALDLFSNGASAVYFDDVSLQYVGSEELYNVAPLGIATQSTTGFGGTANRANDGNRNGTFNAGSVSHTAADDPAPAWEVELSDDFPIERILLWNRTDCCSDRLTNFRVSILDSEREVVAEYDVYTDAVGRPNPSLTLDTDGAEGRIVRVERLGTIEEFPGQFFVSLAEVEVYTLASLVPPRIAAHPQGATISVGECRRFGVGLANVGSACEITYQWQKDGEDIPGATEPTLFVSEVGASDAGDYSVIVTIDGEELVSDAATLVVNPPNLALSGTARQSSDGAGSNAGRAIDGNTSGNWGDGSTTHTAVGDLEPTLEVELAEVSQIDQIVLWNRTDCCSDRLTNFRVSILDELGEEVFAEEYFTDLTFPSPNFTIDVGGLEGLTVRVTRMGVAEDFPANSFVLSLAEVQIFGPGEPPPPPENIARRCGAIATQSSQLGGFAAGNAINGSLGDFTHTAGGDAMARWQVELPADHEIGSIELFNRTSCCGSRLRDIIVSVLDADGEVVFESELLNPENEQGAFPAGPPSLYVDIQFDGGGPVVGRTVVVSRVADPDLSGSGGQGDANESNVLSLGEVVVLPPISCEGSGNATCDGLEVTSIEGPNFAGLYAVSVSGSGSDPEGDPLTYAFVVEGEGGVVAEESGVLDGTATATFLVPEGAYAISFAVDDHPICPASEGSVCVVEVTVPVDTGVGPFLRGDCDGNGTATGNVNDAIVLLNYNFSGGPVPGCLAACDANGDGAVVGGVTDSVYMLNFNFLGGPAPVAPFPVCGTSDLETDETLGCELPLASCE